MSVKQGQRALTQRLSASVLDDEAMLSDILPEYRQESGGTGGLVTVEMRG